MRMASVAFFKRRFGGEILRHAGLHVAAIAAVERFGGAIGEQTRRLDAGRHFGELELDRLMLADRLAEGLACLRVGNRFAQRGLRDANATRRDVDAAEFQSAKDLLEARAPRTPPIRRSAGTR